jgi:hypothetical protein
MKKTYLVLTTVAFSAIFSIKSSGQSAIVSAGSSASNSSGSVSGSVGQLGYTYQSNASGSVDAGVQKAYEIFIVEGVEETALNLKIQAYPNPTTDLLQLQIDGNSPGDFTYQLSDLNGNLLYSARALSNITTLDMRAYSASIYFLTIKSTSTKTKTFKIVKH